MIDINNFNAEVSSVYVDANMYACVSLSLKVLDLLYLLVKYGYYANLDDIKDLMPPLVSLLNGMNDKPFPNASDDQSISFRQVCMY